VDLLLFRASDEPQLWEAALDIRREVFIHEQAVPESEEVDSHDTADDSCIHALLREGGVPAATGRLYEAGERIGRIGRMAVLAPYRGRGMGSAILEALINEAMRCRMRRLVLDAQTHAVPFYERWGFAAEGRPFLDCGIVHQAMRRDLA
jgi:predicted GNAT family N-acyltransferase